MLTIDFKNMTSDGLLEIIPSTETKDWEFKDALVFDKANFKAFKNTKLGKIVSSFANSGGGFLLLGKRDDEERFDPVPMHQGRTTMEDHLSLVISQAVTPHYRDFSIFRVPIAGTEESVLVVQFADSPAAPHQSVADTNYFYRLPGHSVPAPHFHLELLRSRFTRSVVKVTDIRFHCQTIEVKEGLAHLNFVLYVTVENTSLQSATAWGVHIKTAKTDYRWEAVKLRQALNDGVCVRGEQTTLLPSEKAVVPIHVRGKEQLKFRTAMAFCDLADAFDVFLRPLSHDFVGEEIPFRIDRSDVQSIRQEVAEKLS